MKPGKKIALGLVVGIVMLLAIGFFLPSSVRVQRSREIAAKPEAVMAFVSDFRRWPDWSPWVEQDPNISWSYSGPQQGVGATQTWVGPKVGRGRMTITSVGPRAVDYDLWFDDSPTANAGGIELAPTQAGTKLTWYYEAKLGTNPFTRWFGSFLDFIVGRDLERGLERLDALFDDRAGM